MTLKLNVCDETKGLREERVKEIHQLCMSTSVPCVCRQARGKVSSVSSSIDGDHLNNGDALTSFLLTCGVEFTNTFLVPYVAFKHIHKYIMHNT